MDAAEGGSHAKRLSVMASYLTSDQPGRILAMLETGAASLDELAGRSATGTSRDWLLMLLRELRDAGFVLRSTEAGPPLRVSYMLTDDGRNVLNLTMFLSTWLSNKDESEFTVRFWNSLRMTPAGAATRNSGSLNPT